MLSISTRKKLTVISCQVQDTARRLSRPNITIPDMLHEKKMLDVHSSNLDHLLDETINELET